MWRRGRRRTSIDTVVVHACVVVGGVDVHVIRIWRLGGTRAVSDANGGGGVGIVGRFGASV